MNRALPALTLVVFAACSKFEGAAEPESADKDGGVVVEAGTTSGPDAQGEPADASTACVLPAGTNVDTDPHHCGKCGHDCLGGACSAGVCLPRLLGSWTAPLGVAVAGDKLYVAHNTGIDRCALDGTIETNIAPGAQVQYLAAAGDTLYFTTPFKIAAINLGSGASRVLQDSATDFLGIALSPTEVFFSRLGLKPIQRLPLSANTAVAPKTVVAEFNQAQGLAWSADSLYIASPDGTNSVVLADALGTLGAPIVTSGRPIAVAIDGPDVFVARQGTGAPNSGDILRLRGGEVQIIASAQGGDVAALAVTPTAIYWSAFSDGNVKRIAR